MFHPLQQGVLFSFKLYGCYIIDSREELSLISKFFGPLYQ